MATHYPGANFGDLKKTSNEIWIANGVGRIPLASRMEISVHDSRGGHVNGETCRLKTSVIKRVKNVNYRYENNNETLIDIKSFPRSVLPTYGTIDGN